MGTHPEYSELVSSWGRMSQYSESLRSSKKVRYLAKLQAVGFTLEVNPYSKESGGNFETIMTIWPARGDSYFWLLYHLHRFIYYRSAPILETAIGLYLFPKATIYVRTVYTRRIGNQWRRHAMPLKGLCHAILANEPLTKFTKPA